MSRAPRIYISAGEPSGDAHAAAVVTALKRRLPEASVEAFGGPGLEAAGAAVLDRMEHFSVVGFVEALWKLPAHLRLLGRVRLALRARRYDLVILVDYPGYHLRVAAEAAAAGIPVLYYIAPQMWAWAPGRVRKLAAVRRLAVILPFEEAFFRERGVAATFVTSAQRPDAAAPAGGCPAPSRTRPRAARARPLSGEPRAGSEATLAGVPRCGGPRPGRAPRRTGRRRRHAARPLPRPRCHPPAHGGSAHGVRGRRRRSLQVGDDHPRGGGRRRAH